MPAGPASLAMSTGAALVPTTLWSDVRNHIDTEVRVVAGVPAEELLKAGEGADLVVVGSRGVGGFSRLLLGSVSSQVVQHATCPIVVIPKARG